MSLCHVLDTLPLFASGLVDRWPTLVVKEKHVILNEQQQQKVWRRPETAEKKVSGNWCGMQCTGADWKCALWNQLGNWNWAHLLTP